jgi:hypothetical protein
MEVPMERYETLVSIKRDAEKNWQHWTQAERDACIRKATSHFRILGCLWCEDLVEEAKAYRDLISASRCDGFGYW